MAISAGTDSVSLEDILSKTTEANILAYYLGITSIPCIINSPLRKDKRPSFGLYSPNGDRVYYTDLSTKDKGGIYDLLSQLWNTDYRGVLSKINKDIPKFTSNTEVSAYQCTVRSVNTYSHDTELQCRVREWREYDVVYWALYGIRLKWLQYAEVYPISHKIIIKGNQRFVFGADKYAYAYVEHKEGKVTLKIYQPFNRAGYKWSNKHDRSVVSLWTKVPRTGENICICSSLKDALCVWANTGIPCLAVQGEGYSMSITAINDLKQRYKNIFVCFDNDEAGLLDGKKLSEETGFINVVLPQFEDGKDCSDLYKSLHDPQEFKEIMVNLFKERLLKI